MVRDTISPRYGSGGRTGAQPSARLPRHRRSGGPRRGSRRVRRAAGSPVPRGSVCPNCARHARIKKRFYGLTYDPGARCSSMLARYLRPSRRCGGRDPARRGVALSRSRLRRPGLMPGAVRKPAPAPIPIRLDFERLRARHRQHAPILHQTRRPTRRRCSSDRSSTRSRVSPSSATSLCTRGLRALVVRWRPITDARDPAMRDEGHISSEKTSR